MKQASGTLYTGSTCCRLSRDVKTVSWHRGLRVEGAAGILFIMRDDPLSHLSCAAAAVVPARCGSSSRGAALRCVSICPVAPRQGRGAAVGIHRDRPGMVHLARRRPSDFVYAVEPRFGAPGITAAGCGRPRFRKWSGPPGLDGSAAWDPADGLRGDSGWPRTPCGDPHAAHHLLCCAGTASTALRQRLRADLFGVRFRYRRVLEADA